jgi:hypothetical protein
LYYVVLAAIVIGLAYFFPAVDRILGGVPLDDSASSSQVLVDGSRVLADGLQEDNRGFDTDLSPRVELALSTLIILVGVVALMLPVAWVYMSTRYSQSHDQQVAQILIFLPLVVAGIVLVVQNSLALAFSLAGVVAAVRFRSTLKDARDLVFIFLAIAVGFAGGVQTMILAAIVSVLFNFLLLITWRHDFGRGALEPTAASQWKAPLKELARWIRSKPGSSPNVLTGFKNSSDLRARKRASTRFSSSRPRISPEHSRTWAWLSTSRPAAGASTKS